MTKRILYCGDTSLSGAAAYLAGLLTNWKWEFDYVPSHRPLSAALAKKQRDLFVFSDYPAERVPNELADRIVAQVDAGAGLLMIGGWESFHGLGGNWDQSPIAAALPVMLRNSDDRVNSDQAWFVDVVKKGHPTIAGLPWTKRPPLVGGFNRIVPRWDAEVILDVTRLEVTRSRFDFEATFAESSPLLIVGRQGEGRTAAFASDVAPHWIGPMVDWGPGPKRVTGRAAGAEAIEVGAAYAQFFYQLLSWCSR